MTEVGGPYAPTAGLHVDRIEWDEDGKTVSLDGLEPEFGAIVDGPSGGGEQRTFKIKSDVSKPDLRNGILYLQLEGVPTTQEFLILFGQGARISPAEFLLE